MLGEVDRASGCRSLDGVAVESAVRVGRGHHACGGHGLADARAGVGGALDLRDFGLAGRAVAGRRVWFRCRLGFFAGAFGGDVGAQREVGAVVVCVHAVRAVQRLHVGVALRRGGSRLLERVGVAVAERVDDVGVRRGVADGRAELACRGGEEQRAFGAAGVEVGGGGVRLRQLGTVGAVRARLDQIVALGLDDAGQVGGGVARARAARRTVLQRGAVERHVIVGGVVQFDEFVLVCGALAAAGQIRLVDDDARPGRRGLFLGRLRVGCGDWHRHQRHQQRCRDQQALNAC